MTGGRTLNKTINKITAMNTSAKIQKTSDKVLSELEKLGFSKLFNWIDYRAFKKETKGKFNQVQEIVNLFIFYSSDLSDFADYEF